MRWDVVIGLLDSPTTGAELGVYNGPFTEALLGHFPRLTLYAVDTWCNRPGYTGKDFDHIYREFDKRTRRFGDRRVVLRMDTVEAAREVADGSLDFVFIDADHSYEAVSADIDAWAGKVMAGGLLCGHDYGHPRFPGVKRAVDERFQVQTGDDCVWWVRC